VYRIFVSQESNDAASMINFDDDTRPRLRVCCAVIERDGRLLAAKRPVGRQLAGKWEFPGGKIEPFETDEQCVVREVHEELGARVNVIRKFDEVPVIGSYICLVPFLCRVVMGEPQPLEHEKLLWVLPADLHTLDWAPADIPIWQQWLAECQ
jgi:8-oxo-dGTP diphosphatase